MKQLLTAGCFKPSGWLRYDGTVMTDAAGKTARVLKNWLHEKQFHDISARAIKKKKTLGVLGLPGNTIISRPARARVKATWWLAMFSRLCEG